MEIFRKKIFKKKLEKLECQKTNLKSQIEKERNNKMEIIEREANNLLNYFENVHKRLVNASRIMAPNGKKPFYQWAPHQQFCQIKQARRTRVANCIEVIWT
jgi:hypothetical protein